MNNYFDVNDNTLKEVDSSQEEFTTLDYPVLETGNLIYSLGSFYTTGIEQNSVLKYVLAADNILMSLSYLHFLNLVYYSSLTTTPIYPEDYTQLFAFDNKTAEPYQVDIAGETSPIFYPMESIVIQKMSGDSFNIAQINTIHSFSDSLVNPTKIYQNGTDFIYTIYKDRRGIVFYNNPFSYKDNESISAVTILWAGKVSYNSNDLFERYGRFIWSKESNSPEYLFILQILQYFFVNGKTLKNFIKILNAVFGIPFIKNITETITSITPVTIEGKIISYTVTTNLETYSVTSLATGIPPVGTVLNKFDMLGEFITAYDSVYKMKRFIVYGADGSIISEEIKPWYEDTEMPWELVTISNFFSNFHDGSILYDGGATYGFSKNLKAIKSDNQEILELFYEKSGGKFLTDSLGNYVLRPNIDLRPAEVKGNIFYYNACCHFLYVMLEQFIQYNLVKVEATVNKNVKLPIQNLAKLKEIIRAGIPVYQYAFTVFQTVWDATSGQGEESDDEFILADRPLFAEIHLDASYRYGAVVPELNEDGTPKQKLKYVQRLDVDGNPMFDANGYPILDTVPLQAVDEDGNPVFDNEGNPVYVPEVDINGNPLYDSDGTPVYKKVYEDWIIDNNSATLKNLPTDLSPDDDSSGTNLRYNARAEHRGDYVAQVVIFHD